MNIASKRIGLLLPSSNTTMEPELYAMAQKDVTVHTARMMLREVTARSLEDMASEAGRAAELLATADIDVIIYGCTSGSLIGGREWETSLVNRLTRDTGTHTISTSGAVVEALRSQGLRRVAVATPYIDEINALEKAFLESHGIEVTAIRGLGMVRNVDIGRVEPTKVTELARSVSGDADGLFISCTNLPTINIIEPLESELEKRVITSNQASMWAALRALGIKGTRGYGFLMGELR